MEKKKAAKQCLASDGAENGTDAEDGVAATAPSASKRNCLVTEAYVIHAAAAMYRALGSNSKASLCVAKCKQ